jgi:7,8-dihydropterin-6-yl-methyl-4-(beta-D-ribofuranosyl)aminobenzene 5'-phosphate synthase
MRVMALIENSAPEDRSDLQPEFGLSMYIERDDLRILFDTGASDAFVKNAAVMDVDLSEIDVAVLSHHHFDHGGGLQAFLDINRRATVYLGQGPLTGRWFKTLAVIKRPIGIDLGLLESSAERFSFVEGTTEIAPGVFLLTEIGSAHERPKGNRNLFVETGEGLVHDPFDHELVMVVHEDDRMVVFSGCSHNGILNMIDAAVTRFPDVPVKAVFGGFHLIGLPFFNSMAASRSEVEEIGRQILKRVEGKVYSGHCTGQKAFGVLEGIMGDSLELFATGASVEV